MGNNPLKKSQREFMDDLIWANEMEEIGMFILARAIRKTVRREVYQGLRNSGLPTKKARIQANEIYCGLLRK